MKIPRMYLEDGTVAICENCKRQIIYDKEDGYWDHFEKEENGIKSYSPFCDFDNSNRMHEPLNYKRDERGYYYKS